MTTPLPTAALDHGTASAQPIVSSLLRHDVPAVGAVHPHAWRASLERVALASWAWRYSIETGIKVVHVVDTPRLPAPGILPSEKHCDCGAPISESSKTGRCASCARRARA